MRLRLARDITGGGGRDPPSFLPSGRRISGLERLHLRHLRAVPGDRFGPESVLHRQSLFSWRDGRPLRLSQSLQAVSAELLSGSARLLSRTILLIFTKSSVNNCQAID